jgi:hypothetical protein
LDDTPATRRRGPLFSQIIDRGAGRGAGKAIMPIGYAVDVLAVVAA